MCQSTSIRFWHAVGIITTAVTVTTILYFQRRHKALSKQVEHSQEMRDDVDSPERYAHVQSFPDQLRTKPQAYRLFHDYSSLAVSRDILPQKSISWMLTEYLRHNMCIFASSSEMWVMYLFSDAAARKTFQLEAIKNLQFEVGDVFCGRFIVIVREPGKAEIAMSNNNIEGRLLIGIREEPGSQLIFYNEMLMWKQKASKAFLPMDSSVARYLHEINAWRSLKVGTAYLMTLARQDAKAD